MHFSGLSPTEVAAARAEHGANTLEHKEKISPLRVLLSQFLSPLIYILIFAGVLSLVLKEFVDAAIIFLAVGVNTALGFVQEFKAHTALAALSKVLHPITHVWRSGALTTISVEDVVVGDMVRIEAGDQIPADGWVIEEQELRVNEAVLTGESLPVHKKAVGNADQSIVPSPQDALAARMVYMGTSCLQGVAVLRVIAVGQQTQVGKIALDLSTHADVLTPLQLRLRRLARMLAMIVLVVAAGIIAIGVWRDQPLIEMITLAAALSVSAIPEGLLISLTVILSFGMQRILRNKALVRRLLAAETLGSVSTICTDKTGTLTAGRLALSHVYSEDQERMAQVGLTMKSPSDPLEVAILDWARTQRSESEEQLLDEVPFSSARSFSVKMSDDTVWAVGAPEVIATFLKDPKETRDVTDRVAVYAKQGLRVVAVAHRARQENEQKIVLKKLGRFGFTGFYIFADPVRPGLKKMFQQLHQAGVQVKVITGDHALTAQSVMAEIGLPITQQQVLLGSALRTMDAAELHSKLPNILLFARTAPDQKLQIVKALQSQGEVVAMTGDGVNDAPALKQADIGIVVSSASDVSKSTADMVLLDDNFRTIVTSVEEGRGIYESIRKVVLYLLANSFTETFLIVGSLIFAIPLPISALQVLWINLVTDSFPSIALTLEPKERHLLARPPRKRADPLIDVEVRTLMGMIFVFTGVVGLALYWWLLPIYELQHLRTLIFSLIAIMSLLYTFSCRSLRTPAWKMPLKDNLWIVLAVGFGLVMQLLVVYVPLFQRAFDTVPLTILDWGIIAGLGTLLLGFVELGKWISVHNISQSSSHGR